MPETTERLTARAAENLLVSEARLLDEGRFEDWLTLFTGDAWYWLPSQPGQASPKDTVSLIYDDRRLLETRVRRLRNAHMHSQQPASRTSRIVANVMLEPAEGRVQRVRSKLQLIEFRRDRQRLFAGTCWHGLVHDGSGWRFAWKRVDLVNCDGELDGLAILF